MKICGIYKIISPSGKIYIGQSIDIERRFSQYRKGCTINKSQKKLYNSFKKYGEAAHSFEIIEIVEFELINIRERYWQDYYDVLNPICGLNLMLTKTNILPCKVSEETKNKIRNKLLGVHKGKTYSKEHRRNLSISHTGYKMPQIQRDKISQSNKGKCGKKLLDIISGKEYESLVEAAKDLNIKYGTLRAMLNGQLKNKTNLITK